MTENLKIEVSMVDVEGGLVDTSLATKQELAAAVETKADLIQGKVPVIQLPGFNEISGVSEALNGVETKLRDEMSTTIANNNNGLESRINEKLVLKADLVNGRVPASQSPAFKDVEGAKGALDGLKGALTAKYDQKVKELSEGKADLVDGKIPTSQLPIDDIVSPLEFELKSQELDTKFATLEDSIETEKNAFIAQAGNLIAGKANAIDVYDKVAVDNKLGGKVDKATYVGEIVKKADQAYVDNALTGLSNGSSKFYPTLDLANADIANLAVNQPVNVGESANGGLWYKATAGATTLTKSPYDPLTQSKTYTDDSFHTLEINKTQNSNKFKIDQVLFERMPTSTTGTATVVTRNGIKQLKLVSASSGGHIIAFWDFDASLFTGEFAGSLTIEDADAGSNGYVGIQQISSSGSIIATSYAQTAITSAITKRTFKALATGVVSGAVKIRLIAYLQTTTTRQMHVHSPFIADGTNADFIAPEPTLDLTPIEADVALIGGAFDVVAAKNMFNPALSTDGKIISYEAGTLATFANGIAFSKVAVQKGETYTFWIPANSSFYFKEFIYTFAADGSYLGLDRSAGSAYEKLNPIPPSDVAYRDGSRTVTFTIPSNSQIAYVQMMAEYSTHTTAQFNELVNSMQFELGGVKTAFEAHDPNVTTKMVLKESALPATSSPTVSENKNTFTVTLDGTDAYIRTKFSDTLDLVQQVRYGTNNIWSNNVINPWVVRTIPASTSKGGVISAFSSGAVLAVQGDDAAPLNYNGTYIGANHGAYIVRQVTVNSHGKTYADVGSRWTQGANTYTIVRIVDANKLWLVSQNIGTTYWQFVTSSLNGLTLTHSAGATNTTSFTPSADLQTQLYSAINNHTKKIVADGFKELTAAGVYDVEYVEFIDNYDIMNPVSILTYLQSRVGTTTEQNLSVDSIASDVRVGVNYRYALNGSCTVTTQLHKKANINFNFAGLIQANPLSYSGKTLIEYANKMKPVTVSGTSYDLSATIDATNNTAVINMLKADWLDATNPPDRMLYLVKNGSNKEFGQVLGYSLTRGATKPSVRQNTTDAGFFNNPTTKKVYPKALVSNLDAVVNAVAYRSTFNPAVLPQATVYTWYEDNGEIFVILDIHQSVSMLKLPLPETFNGKSAEVVDDHANFTLHSEIVSDGGLLCSIQNNYASVVVKLS